MTLSGESAKRRTWSKEWVWSNVGADRWSKSIIKHNWGALE